MKKQNPKQLDEILKEYISQIVEKSKPLNAEYQKIIDKHFWEPV